MRFPTVVCSVSLLVLLAHNSAPNFPPRHRGAVALSLTTPAEAETTDVPIVSPNHSVRRAHPGEVSTGRAPLPSECEGNACGVVQVAWLDPGYRFTNTGARDVSIRIWFAANGECLLSEFSVAPTKSSGWGNTGFCKPYRASYK